MMMMVMMVNKVSTTVISEWWSNVDFDQHFSSRESIYDYDDYDYASAGKASTPHHRLQTTNSVNAARVQAQARERQAWSRLKTHLEGLRLILR